MPAAPTLLVVNLGTPEAPTPKAVRQFLLPFLSDTRVVDLPPYLWQPLLRAVVLPLRVGKVAANYRKVWLPQGSPLLVGSKRVTEELARHLPQWRVRLAMRYGPPHLAQALAEVEGPLVVLPLYPQWASSTSASVMDAVAQHYRHSYRVPPSVQFLPDWAEQDFFIDALAASLRQRRSLWQEDLVLVSFHGLPLAHIERGDVYLERCRATFAALTRALPEMRLQMVFQSRFGRGQWLTPALDQTLHQLPAQGVRKLRLLCPGFVADCLETLEEVAIGGQETFLEAGGEAFDYVPALASAALDWTLPWARWIERQVPQ